MDQAVICHLHSGKIAEAWEIADVGATRGVRDWRSERTHFAAERASLAPMAVRILLSMEQCREAGRGEIVARRRLSEEA